MSAAAHLHPAPSTRVPGEEWLLRALLVEKVVQHAFVTWALATDRFGIRDGLAVDPRALAVAGGVVGVLFGVALFGHVSRQPWSLGLIAGLAVFDVVGEFVAQGTPEIVITLSFVVALVVLVLIAREWSRTSRRKGTRKDGFDDGLDDEVRQLREPAAGRPK